MRKFEYKYKVDEENKVVVALSTFAGRPVSGVARCAPNDVFDVAIGKKIAAARCDLKIAARRKKRAEYCAAVAANEAAYWAAYAEKMNQYKTDSAAAYEKALEDIKVIKQF